MNVMPELVAVARILVGVLIGFAVVSVARGLWLEWQNRRVNERLASAWDDEDAEGEEAEDDLDVIMDAVRRGEAVIPLALMSALAARGQMIGIETFDDMPFAPLNEAKPEPEPPKPAPASEPPMEPGRQRLRMSTAVEMTILGPRVVEWSPPGPQRPSVPWEDVHTFPRGCRPVRSDAFGLHHRAPARSLICVGCELEQPPLIQGERRCAYCGIFMALVGSYVEWWREPCEVAPWTP